MQKLSITEKFGYGLGDLAANFVFQAVMALQLDFYTQTYGLSPAAAGTMFLVVGLGSAALQSRHGSYCRPHRHALGPLPALAAVDLVPLRHHRHSRLHHAQHQPHGKLIYAWVTYLLLRLVYAANNVPYSSFTAVMTDDPDERNFITSYRQFFANSAGFIVGALAVPMVKYLGGGNSALGYQLTMGSFLALSIVLFLVAFAVSKERIQPDTTQETSVTRDLGDLVHNRSWVLLFLATVFYFTALLIRGNVMLPYFENLAHNRILFSWLNGFGLIALLVGVTCSTTLVKKWGKRNVFFWVACFSPPFAPPRFTSCSQLRSSPSFRLKWCGSSSIGCSGPVLWSMMADVADYGEWKTGRRATGAAISGVVFALWVGVALGGAIAAWLLSFFGYDSHANVQTARAQLGIQLTPSVFAGLSFLGVAVCLWFYPITRELNHKIANDLAERRKKFAPPVSS